MKFIKSFISLAFIISMSSCCALAWECFDDVSPTFRLSIDDKIGANLLDTTKPYGEKLLTITINGDGTHLFKQIHELAFDSTVFKAFIEFSGIKDSETHSDIRSDTFYLKFDTGNIDTMITDRIREVKNCCPRSEVKEVRYNHEKFTGGKEFVTFRYTRD